mgnify:FL=1
MSLSQNPFYNKNKEDTRAEAEAETRGIEERQRFEEERRKKTHQQTVKMELSRLEMELKRKTTDLTALEREIDVLEEKTIEYKRRHGQTGMAKPRGRGTDHERALLEAQAKLTKDTAHVHELETKIREAKQHTTEHGRTHTTHRAEIEREKGKIEDLKDDEKQAELRLRHDEADIKELERKLA